MQAEAGLTVVLFQQLMVEVDLLPVLEHVRLALGQTRAHGEAGFRHVQCLFVLHNASPFIVIFRLSAKQKNTPVSRRDKGATTSAVPLSLPAVQQPARPHQPWAREGNGPPPSVPTVVSAGSSGVIFAGCLVSAFHQTAALLARKQALLIPIIADMLYKRYFTRTFAVCQPEKASKSPQSANNFCVFCQRGRGRGARNS